jgi:methylated-DNA-[protein]-cysteine S-methyltransferase
MKKMNSGVIYAQMDAPVGAIWIASTSVGICTIGIGDGQPERFFAWLSRRIDPEPPREEPETLDAALTQLREYFSGARRSFDLPLDVRGTVFQKAAWDEIARIPYGATTTYGEIARRIGKPQAARAVGAANGANPLPIIIPCHRVLGANGSLTGYGGGLEMKAALLRLEGVCLL